MLERTLVTLDHLLANFKATTGTFFLSVFAQFNPQTIIVTLTIFVLACQAISWSYRGYCSIKRIARKG